jgi:hypothetical protein
MVEQDLFTQLDIPSLLNFIKKGVTIQDIATSMNTSERMIMSVYLGLSDQTLVERHKRVYGNMKIIK